MTRIYVAEIQAHDGAALHTFYYSTVGFTSTPTDTPSNTLFDARLLQPCLLKRSLFSSGTTSGESTADYGDLILNNTDEALDFLNDYGCDGRVLIVRSGVLGTAYPSTFTTEFKGTMSVPTFVNNTVVIKVKSRQLTLTAPLQVTKFAGTNVAPNGLEGLPTDLQGKPKPVILGAPSNVSALLVNTSKQIYQVHDGALADIAAVYDKGVLLKTGRVWNAATSLNIGTLPNAIYVACTGLSLVLAADHSTFKLYTSADNGATWTLRQTLPALIFSIAFNGTTFALISNGDVYSSTTGTSFTVSSSAFGARYLAWSTALSLWIAVGNGGLINTSPDLITWTTRTSGTTRDLTLIAAGDACVVVVTDNGNIHSSDDGITWTLRVTAATNSALFAGVYANGRFVFIGQVLLTSLDGLTWSRLPVPPTPATPPVIFQVITGLDGLFFTISSRYMCSSPDLVNWTINDVGAIFNYPTISAFVNNGVQLTALNISGGVTYTTHTTYANTTDLQDDSLAPHAGEFLACPSSGYFRLGSPPVGTVTCDPIEGASSSARTVGQSFVRVLQRAGFTTGDWSASDITALDVINSAVIGGAWLSETTFAAVLDELAATLGAWWGLDHAGVFRIQQIVNPASGTSVLTLTANDIDGVLTKVVTQDPGQGLPNYSTILTYAPNYTLQTGDTVSPLVSATRRGVLAQPWATVKALDASVQTKFLRAVEVTEATLFTQASDAQTEATRRQTLRGVKRDRFDLKTELNTDTNTLDLGNVLTLTYRRFGFSGGKKFLVLGVSPDALAKRITLTLWG